MMYEFIKDAEKSNVINVGLEGNIIGYIMDFSSNSKIYSGILEAKAATFEYIQVFKEFRNNNHCTNIVKQLLNSRNCECLVVQKPANMDLWNKVGEKIKQDRAIDYYYFGKLVKRKSYDIQEDLVLVK